MRRERTSFVWGGCMLFPAEALRSGAHGILQARLTSKHLVSSVRASTLSRGKSRSTWSSCGWRQLVQWRPCNLHFDWHRLQHGQVCAPHLLSQGKGPMV